MKAVAYIRVSTDEQVQGTSLDSQQKECLQFAKKNGIELDSDLIFREEGVSAKLIDRPELARMLNYCSSHKGEIAYCIVWKVDRLARKSEYHFLIKATLAKYGVKLISCTEPIGDDPTGSFIDAVLAAWAQFDNDVRTLRTTGGMKARTAQGGWPHSAPFGYRKMRTPTGISTIEPDEYAPVVKEFLEKFASGSYNVKQAVSIAFDLGIRSKKGKKRYWQSIKNMLANPIYAGFVCSKYTNGEKIKGLHEAIIDKETHFRILSILSGNSNKFSREAEVDWPLRGGFLKHICGTAMTGSSPRGRNGPSPRYSCPKCRAKEIGQPVSIRREIVHAEFIDMLGKIRPSNGTIRLFKEIVIRQWNNEFKDALKKSEQLDSEISNLKDRKARILDLFIDGKLTSDEKESKFLEVEKLLNKYALQKIDNEKYVNEKENIIDGAMLFISNPGLFWNLANIDLKKRIQKAIFPEGLEHSCINGFGTVKLSQTYQLIKKISKNSDLNPSLVGAGLTSWNQIKLELITAYELIKSHKSYVPIVN